jgi:ribosomal protein L16 Arg81 hydroxylase
VFLRWNNRHGKEMKHWSLDEVLQPHGWPLFEEKYWQRLPLHISRGNPQFFSSLVSRKQVEFLINTQGGRDDFPISVIGSRIGETVPAEERGLRRTHWRSDNVYERVSKGATVRIGNLAHYFDPVQRLVSGFEAFLNTDIAVNLYLTPGGSQAFGSHFDNHDVFILQVEGSKIWKIFTPPEDLPVEVVYKARPQWFGRKLPFEGSLGPLRPAAQLDREFLLLAGDLLYVPRGYVHQVFTSDEPSLHLTVAAPVLTWYEVAVHALAATFRESRTLREAVPPAFATSGQRFSEAEDKLTDVVAAVRTHLTEDKLHASLEELALRYVNSRSGNWPGITTAIDGAKDITLASVFQIRPSLIYTTRKEVPYIYILFSGRALRVPVQAESMLSHILNVRRFRAADLPSDGADSSHMTLVKMMLARGFIELVD